MIRITRENVNAYLDRGVLYAGMTNGGWWRLRRNGQTKLWKTDQDRIYIPVKAGLRSTTQITEKDFRDDGALMSDEFRHVTDIPLMVRGKRAVTA